MKKDQTIVNDSFEWPRRPVSRTYNSGKRFKKRRESKEREMIRELQAIFCKDRYRYWAG